MFQDQCIEARRASSLCLAVIFGVGAVLAGSGACASAQTYNPGGLDQPTAARIADTCQTVLRVRPNEEHFDNCVESLSDSVRNLGRNRGVDRGRQTCLAHGLAPGSSELAECTLRASEASEPDASLPGAARTVKAEDIPGGERSYFATSPRDNVRREELSCAHLGLDPGTGAFAECVGNLQAALAAADNPM